MTLSETAPDRQSQLCDPETGGTLIIDLNAIEENFRALTRLLPASECAAVVKADAYGLGLEPGTAKLATLPARIATLDVPASSPKAVSSRQPFMSAEITVPFISALRPMNFATNWLRGRV